VPSSTVIGVPAIGVPHGRSRHRPLNLADLGETILDTVTGATRAPLPNAAGIVLAFDALRAVAASHGLDVQALWQGSSSAS